MASEEAIQKLQEGKAGGNNHLENIVWGISKSIIPGGFESKGILEE